MTESRYPKFKVGQSIKLTRKHVTNYIRIDHIFQLKDEYAYITSVRGAEHGALSYYTEHELEEYGEVIQPPEPLVIHK